MTDDPPKKRPWFQIHLSTAIVLMFVAGVLVWANLYSWDEANHSDSYYSFHGWPLAVVRVDWMQTEVLGNSRDFLGLANDLVYLDWFFGDLFHLLLDSALALAILTAIAVGCEWLIRFRRERNNTEG